MSDKVIDKSNFTTACMATLDEALAVARKAEHPFCYPEHLLIAIINQKTNKTTQTLITSTSCDPVVLKDRCEAAIKKLPVKAQEKITFTEAMSALFTKAWTAVEKMGNKFISNEHLLIAMSELEDPRAGVAQPTQVGRIMRDLGVTSEKLYGACASVRPYKNITTVTPEKDDVAPRFAILREFGHDLTEAAALNQLDPFIGRQDEIRRMITVLSRRTKNNPVLLGDTGVGKNAIVEGLPSVSCVVKCPSS